MVGAPVGEYLRSQPYFARRAFYSRFEVASKGFFTTWGPGGVHRLASEADTLPRVPGDPRALNQVFLNLLKNAAEALDGRGGTISVAARPDEDSVVVEVGDDGPGIDPEVQMRLFDPFFSTKEAGRGTGLGLSISRRIVVEHGGSLDVRSAPGQGTTFTLRLPRRRDEGDEGSGRGA